MRTVVVMNKKGGVGKTTLSDEIAFALERMGRKVSFLSVDPQVGAIHGPGEAGADADWLVVDTKGVLDEQSALIVAKAQPDWVVVPTMPSARSLPSTAETLDVVAREVGGAKVAIVLNGYTDDDVCAQVTRRVRDRSFSRGAPIFLVRRSDALERAALEGTSAWEHDPLATYPIEVLAEVMDSWYELSRPLAAMAASVCARYVEEPRGPRGGGR